MTMADSTTVNFLEEFFAGDPAAAGCIRCRDAAPFLRRLRMAFQPIVDMEDRQVFAYEALVRGANGESAAAVIADVAADQMYTFDQTCRVLAIETAQRVGLQGFLSINFLPNAVYDPATCIRLTLAAADRVGFATDRLIFELTEGEKLKDPDHAVRILRDYQKRGFLSAIDDFGAGYSGLNLLAEFQPDFIKLDMALTRNIDRERVRQAIVAGVISTCNALGCKVIAEGIETREELATLREMGVRLFQGYLLARPQIEALPDVDYAAALA
jgi:EAL domain-containing protein (putative c-di-GMP-specific phosphodiesterase class I)